MATPPTPEALAVYESLGELEETLHDAASVVRRLKRAMRRHHAALDALRKSLGADSPSPEQLKAMSMAPSFGQK